jgi:hypothetical protein
MNFLKKAAMAVGLVVVSAVAAAAFPAVATTNVSVRAGPGNNYPVVDRLYPGQTVNVVSRSGSWYEIAGTGFARSGSFDVVSRSYAPSYYYRDRYDRYDFKPNRRHHQLHSKGNYGGSKRNHTGRVGSGAPGKWRPGAGGSSR